MTLFLTDAFFGFHKGSIFRAHDFEHAFYALIAVLIFWYFDRRRSSNERGAVGYFVLWIQYFFGIHALFSGLVYFLHPSAQPVMGNPIAAQFQASLQSAGLFTIVKYIEVIVGICLVSNKFVPLAAIFEMPISVMIFYMSIFVDLDDRTVWTGPKELLSNVIILTAYFGYFRPIFAPSLDWRPIWKRQPELNK